MWIGMGFVNLNKRPVCIYRYLVTLSLPKYMRLPRRPECLVATFLSRGLKWWMINFLISVLKFLLISIPCQQIEWKDCSFPPTPSPPDKTPKNYQLTYGLGEHEIDNFGRWFLWIDYCEFTSFVLHVKKQRWCFEKKK